MTGYTRWMLSLVLVVLATGSAAAEDSLFSKLDELKPTAHKLLQEAYDESCIVFDALDRIAKERSAEPSKTTKAWETVTDNHEDYWLTRIRKAARLLGTTSGSAGSEAESRATFPSSHKSWVTAQHRLFEDVRTKGAKWIDQMRVIQWRLNAVTHRYKADPEKYAKAVEELKEADKELSDVEKALIRVSNYDQGEALRKRADRAWHKIYRNGKFLEDRSKQVAILQTVADQYVAQFATELKAMQKWRDEVRSKPEIEPRFVKSIVDVWTEEMKKRVEHHKTSSANIKFIDKQLLGKDLLDDIPRFKDLAYDNLTGDATGILNLAYKIRDGFR